MRVCGIPFDGHIAGETVTSGASPPLRGSNLTSKSSQVDSMAC